MKMKHFLVEIKASPNNIQRIVEGQLFSEVACDLADKELPIIAVREMSEIELDYHEHSPVRFGLDGVRKALGFRDARR